MPDSTELWLPVEGYQGRYAVSNHGRVKSLSRRRPNGAGSYVQAERIMRSNLAGAGYPKVGLRDGSGRVAVRYIHRLVAEHFVSGRTDERREVNHKDGDKTNNRAENLEWCTRGYNLHHAHVNGLKVVRPPRGEKHINAKLTEKDIHRIRVLYATGWFRQVDLAAMFRTPQTNVSRIVRRAAWTHVG